MLHCLLLFAASPIWSLLLNCYPPLLVFGLCCLFISILLVGYLSLLFVICHAVFYFQNVRFTHCIALLVCWPLLLTLLVFFRCKEARFHTGAAQNVITEMLRTLKKENTLDAAPMKKLLFRTCHIDMWETCDGLPLMDAYVGLLQLSLCMHLASSKTGEGCA